MPKGSTHTTAIQVATRSQRGAVAVSFLAMIISSLLLKVPGLLPRSAALANAGARMVLDADISSIARSSDLA